MSRHGVRWAMVAGGLLAWTGSSAAAQAGSYLFYVASESQDEVALVRLTPGEGLAVAKTIPVGWLPAEIEAPHGVYVDPDGAHWYLTLGHGFPFGSLIAYATGADTVEGRVGLGMFPATVSVAPFGDLAFAVNSDFHGDRVPSSVSIVDLGSMIEIARVETCTMPHGSRFAPDGLHHYSTCMVDDQLVEIDVSTLEVDRRLDLVTGESLPLDRTMTTGRSRQQCSPTWAAPSPDGRFVYVPCNKGNEVIEVDLQDWRITRRLPTPGAPYNAMVTPDGSRLAVTLKGAARLGVIDLTDGALHEVPTTRRVTHGVSVTPDGRFAVVSVEGIGGEPGTVDAIDLKTLTRVGSVDIGKQAGGIVFWRTDGPT